MLRLLRIGSRLSAPCVSSLRPILAAPKHLSAARGTTPWSAVKMASREKAEADALRMFVGIGLPETTAKNASVNQKFRSTLAEIITAAGAANGCDRGQGILLYNIASKYPANALVHRPKLLEYIMTNKVKSVQQLEGAFDYLKKIGGEQLDTAALDSSAGVGVTVSAEQIRDAVAEAISKHETKLKEDRYHFNTNALVGAILKSLKWVDGAALRAEMEQQVPVLLGITGVSSAIPTQGQLICPIVRASGAVSPSAGPAADLCRRVSALRVVSAAVLMVVIGLVFGMIGQPPPMHLQVLALLGPKTEEDSKPREIPAKKAKAAKTDESKAVEAAAAPTLAPAAGPTNEATVPAAASEDPYSHLPRPEDNNMVHTTVNFSDGRIMRIANTPAKLAEHLQRTGGRVQTRFPPEPNGYLHIGHAKAMNVSFGMAEHYNGVCYLRYDDTNPEAEKLEYIEHIVDIVAWMGWKPWRTTYSSDYFQQLYDLAVQLIKSGNAFVCHQTKDQIEASRERREPSPWRDRPVEENLALFEDMRRGMVDEGGATLRMKMDHKNENYNMFDLIAYRVKFTKHPHAGAGWCIYPSYDYTHCIVDALEDITHSLCTLEFESRRASYYWLLEVLDLYKPVVWEYSRLNVTNTVMSKRKLNQLVTQNHVKGWDDPRLLTLAGLRRRGATPKAINSFCKEIGITRNENMMPMHKLEHHIRADLDAVAPRTLAVLRPLKVVITNMPEDRVIDVTASRFPGRGDGTPYQVPVSRVVYIESTDFRLQDEKDYYGLAPGKTVMLRYAFVITYAGHSTDPAGRVVEVQATYSEAIAGTRPPKGVLNWVAQPQPGVEPLSMEVRLYDPLFKSENPQALDAWLEDINPKSLVVLKGAYGSPALASAQVGDKFQFERLGYFVVDPDSTPAHLVFNRTVTLRESIPKTLTKKR